MLPDLAFSPTDMQVTRARGSSEDSLTAAITVHNLGPVDANHAAIALSEGTALPFATLTVNVPADGQATISTPWKPTHLDTTRLTVYVDARSAILQSRYDND